MSEELERTYKVPLGKVLIAPRHRRTPKAVRMLRHFAKKHMHSDEVKLDPKLNEIMWNRGIRTPPRKITVKMVRDKDGVVTVTSAE